MVYRDDLDPPFGHQPLPYDPWDDPDNPPVAPADDDLRRAVREAMDRHPGSPSRIKADLKRHGHGDIPLGVIHGVKAGM